MKQVTVMHEILRNESPMMVRSASNDVSFDAGYDEEMEGKEGPHIAAVAALIGDRARSEILTALLGGQALTATELAGVADITKQTASSHLARLVEGRLVAVQRQGRHAYFRLADDDVAHLLESLMGVAFRSGAL